MKTEFDAKRAMLKGPDLFNRLRLEHAPEPMESVDLSETAELLIFEAGGERFGFRLEEIAYHHVAQGTVNGEEVMIGFCEVCHSGAKFSPIVEGRTLHFSCGGLYDGIALLIDDETRSYWNHMTGECVHGELKGKQLPIDGVQMTTVEAELERTGTKLYTGKLTWYGRMMKRIAGKAQIGKDGFIPPFFYMTMSKLDKRLERKTQGLGVVIDGVAKFYPTASIGDGLDDTLNDLVIHVAIRPEDSVPFAVFPSGDRPFQMFCRWYGFSATFADCQLWAKR